MASKSRNSTPPSTRPAAPRVTTPPSAADRTAMGSPRSPNRPSSNDEQIRKRAYSLWEQAGCPECDGVEFWLEAEKELHGER